ncbi:MAG: methyltransferase domain-containing protein [Candidatus Altiarchaeota archaeon]
MATADDVKDANRRFFDLAADVYEGVDKRRGDKVSRWLDDGIGELSKRATGGALLDIGCGTGFVMRKSNGKFNLIVGVDISPNMLKQTNVGYPVCADTDYLPFKGGVFDAAASVAVLHHILDHKSMFQEAQRVLRKGGVFYSDHDIDSEFVKKFGWLVRLRRRFCDNSIAYLRAKKDLTKELYEKSEIHHDGVDSPLLKTQLQDAGFSKVKVRYHWLGLNTALNVILSLPPLKYLPHGFAPNASFWAVK